MMNGVDLIFHWSCSKIFTGKKHGGFLGAEGGEWGGEMVIKPADKEAQASSSAPSA